MYCAREKQNESETRIILLYYKDYFSTCLLARAESQVTISLNEDLLYSRTTLMPDTSNLNLLEQRFVLI